MLLFKPFLHITFSMDDFYRIKNANVALVRACYDGNLKMVKWALKNGADDFVSALYTMFERTTDKFIEFFITKYVRKSLDLLNLCLCLASKRGGNALIDFVIQYGADINYGLFGACWGCNQNLAKWMIERGATNFKIALMWACRGGNRDIIDLIIKHGEKDKVQFLQTYTAKGAKHMFFANTKIDRDGRRISTQYFNAWDCGLFGACEFGHLSIADYMISKGATDVESALYIVVNSDRRMQELYKTINYLLTMGAKNMNMALISACESGNNTLVRFFISKGAFIINDALSTYCEYNNYQYNDNIEVIDLLLKKGALIEDGLKGSCAGGIMENIKYMISLGAHDFSLASKFACVGGHFHVVQFLDNMKVMNWHEGFIGACQEGHRLMMNLAFQSLSHDARNIKTWNRGLNAACAFGHIEIAQHLIKLGATDLNSALEQACDHGEWECIKFLISKGADAFNRGLSGACWGGYRDIADYMIEKGATDFNSGLKYACNRILRSNGALAKYMISKGATDFKIALIGAFDARHTRLYPLLLRHAKLNRQDIHHVLSIRASTHTSFHYKNNIVFLKYVYAFRGVDWLTLLSEYFWKYPSHIILFKNRRVLRHNPMTIILQKRQKLYNLGEHFCCKDVFTFIACFSEIEINLKNNYI